MRVCGGEEHHFVIARARAPGHLAWLAKRMLRSRRRPASLDFTNIAGWEARAKIYLQPQRSGHLIPQRTPTPAPLGLEVGQFCDACMQTRGSRAVVAVILAAAASVLCMVRARDTIRRRK